MTTDQINALNDDQLDAAIAEMFEAKPTTKEQAAISCWWAWDRGDIKPWTSPASGIEDAWRVVEAMRERGYVAAVVCMLSEGRLWCASFHHRANGRGATASGDSAPQAICRAALATAGIDAGRKT